MSRIRLLALVAVLALVAAACGDDEPAATTAAATTTKAAPTTTQATTTTAPAASTSAATTTTQPVVRADADLVIWADDTRAPVIQTFADEFAKANGVTVAVQELPFGDIRDRLVVADPAGEGPDIIIGAHDWLGKLVTSGVVAPIDLGGVEDEYSAASVAAFNYEGKTYGLPYAVENIALIRNTDLVPTAPKTFEELAKTALQLVTDGKAKLPLALQQNGNGDPYHNYPLFTSYGGYVFGRNADGSYNPKDLGIDSKGGLAAAKAFSDYAAQGLIDVDVTYDIMTASFGAGEAPFAITGPWAVSTFEDVNFVVEPIPPAAGGKPTPFIGVQGFMVAAHAKNPVFASTFVLDFMATEDAQAALFEAGGRPPANLAAFAKVSADDPVVAGFGKSGANGYPMPSIAAMDSVWQAWTDAYQLILTGGDAEKAFTDAAAQIRAKIGS